MEKIDITIIGAGVVGLAITAELIDMGNSYFAAGYCSRAEIVRWRTTRLF